ncbi:unnamed protein product [Peronospora farinosa]|uniref:PX domain-containing protein n=1 Tax=Peronospora farinosa TaxID=134698 RepID=A0AAV0SQP4_9STRA|nr:unnamed protein product [Peronospora farinosa]CAI5705957.1 unnamed protein product [Peronospora farinosa]
MTRLFLGLVFVLLLTRSGSFWWILRSYQLQKEQELLDQALVKVNFYRKYRHYTGTNDGTTATIRNRLPIVAHLRTFWSLPPELCNEITALVELIVKDYVSFWFQAISPNEDFPNDVKFLLADLLGAIASRVLEIDPSQAVTIVAKSLELLRLHLGWFREAYAQLADDYPAVFEGDEMNSNLLKRQEYVAAFVQRSPFVHPGCVKTKASAFSPMPGGNSMGKENAGENAEAAYLRHVATQLLTQLKPQLGQHHDTNMFVSVAMNLLREIVGFKILKPLSEYAQPRYANEIVLSCLQAFANEKDVVGPTSPSMSSSSNVAGMVPSLTLKKIRSTSSILYKASRRSGEQAEAAFQAVVEAVASAASSAAAGAAETVSEGDDWTDSGSTIFAFGSAVFAANSGGFTGERKAMSAIFAMDDRLKVAKAAKMMDPRGLISGGLLSHKMAGDNSRITAHMDDLKNAKANLGSSLNSSIGKVKRRFRTLSNYQMDPMSSTSPLGTGTGAAARMIRKPGQLLQKAWKRGESGASSPSSSYDDGAITPTDRIRGGKSAHVMSSLNSLVSPPPDDEEETTSPTERGTMTMAMVRDRVVRHVAKAVADYTKMYYECPEMHSSVRSRELYDLLSAMENVFMLGFRNHDSEDEGDHTVLSTPPPSPNVRRRFSVASASDELTSCRDSIDTDRCPSYLDIDVNDNQYYWEYLVQERPGAKLFNAHSRFVASQCPPCSPSESFVSTRGAQWVLAALVKGSLGTFCAELYAHSDVTELYYESYALLLDTTLADSVLGALSQLDDLKVSLDVPIFSFQSDMDKELGVSPSNEWRFQDVASLSAPVSVLERVWEIEHYVPINGWVKATDQRYQELPSSEWIWEDDWALENAAKDLGESLDSEAMDSTWEYAKTYEDKFHEKRRKSDSVRRRRWVRRRCQLPPVLVLPSSPVSPSDFDVSSSSASSAIPKSAGRASKLKQRFDALTREKKNDKGTAANKSLPKSGSKKHDKEMPEGPISDLTLGLIDSDSFQQTSTKTSAFMKARASIPSIRRGMSCMSIKSPSFDSRSLSAEACTDDDRGALYDIDDNDDENLCSRCLNALSSSNLGVGTCHSCHQRMCSSCLNFYAFMAYPPPRETSKKARVCENCYDRLVSKYKLRVEAHLGNYLIKEREIPDISNSSASSTNTATSTSHHSVSSTSNGSNPGVGDSAAARQTSSLQSPTVSRTDSNRFKITVKVKDNSADAWSVTKTYHDFEELEKQLTDRLKKQKKKCGKGCHLRGVDYTELTSIKLSLKTVAATSLTYEKQLHILEQFLQQLLACDTLCQSSVVQKFLLLANASGTSPATVNSSMSGWEAGEDPTSPSATGGGALSNEAESNGPRINSAEGVLFENGKWRIGRWVAPDANSKETKMRVLQKIEVSLFAVLGEVFEFDGIGMVRRQIFSMTRSFIKAFLSASHFRMLEQQFLSFTDPKKLSGWIGDLQVYLFSDLSDAKVAPPPAPDMQVLRKNCFEAILASFPSKALSLFGDTACENAALKLHEFLQHEVFIKNLLFSIADELLLHLFPDSTSFQGQQGTRRTSDAVAASIDNDTSDVVMSPTSPLPAPLLPQASKRRRSSAQSK